MYTYDAWNRLVSAGKWYRDGSGTLQSGGTFVTMAYDGRGRRIRKTVDTGGKYLDCAFHYYMDGDSMVEVRDGSDIVLALDRRSRVYLPLAATKERIDSRPLRRGCYGPGSSLVFAQS